LRRIFTLLLSMALLDALTEGLAIGSVKLPARAVRDQARLDTCFSCAIAAVLEGRGLAVPELAPAFHAYYAYEGGGALGGITLERARVTMNVRGICAQRLYDHNIAGELPLSGPDDDAIRDAARRRTSADLEGNPTFALVRGPSRASAWARELASGYPILARIWQNTGYLALQSIRLNPVWQDRDAAGNSHAVAVLGVEPQHERFIVQDSQGESFGDGGQWYLPYGQAESPAVLDAYVLRVPLQRLL
jgi:hypothetical protein